MKRKKEIGALVVELSLVKVCTWYWS